MIEHSNDNCKVEGSGRGKEGKHTEFQSHWNAWRLYLEYQERVKDLAHTSFAPFPPQLGRSLASTVEKLDSKDWVQVLEGELSTSAEADAEVGSEVATIGKL